VSTKSKASDKPSDTTDSPGTPPDQLAQSKKLKSFVGVLGLALIILLVFRPGCGPRDLPGDTTTAGKRLYNAATVMGELITQNEAEPRIILLIPPQKGKQVPQSYIDQAIEGLAYGTGQTEAVRAVVSPQLTESAARELLSGTGREVPNLKKWAPPIEDWLNPEVFETVLRQHPGCNVLVSMVGLPQGSEEEQRLFLSRLKRDYPYMQVCVLRGQLTDISFLKQAFEQNSFIGAILRGRCGEGKIYSKQTLFGTETELKTQLNKGYTLLTKENMSYIAQNCPELIENAKPLE
jgi:hypothetical protein